MATPPAVTLVTPDLASNSTGRTYCLWLLARAAGMETRVLAIQGDEIWPAIDDAQFASDVRRLASTDVRLAQKLSAGSVIVSIKPFETSLGFASSIADDSGNRLVADIDDPDLEAVLSWKSPARRVVRQTLRGSRVAAARRMRRLLSGLPTIVSNPFLQARYGGIIVPHVRPDTGVGANHSSSNPSIAFVGTVRKHKGIEALREAVRRTQDIGSTLTVTAPAPSDARPWERWVGTTSFAAGQAIVRSADVIVIPSVRTPFAEGQLPAKIIDAMLAGRAIVASDLPPIQWALADTGVLVPPGSSDALAAAIRRLTDPATRRRMGHAARKVALHSFTVDANVETFRQAVSGEIPGRPSRQHSRSRAGAGEQDE